MKCALPVPKGDLGQGGCYHPTKISPWRGFASHRGLTLSICPSPLGQQRCLQGLPRSQTILGGFKNILCALPGNHPSGAEPRMAAAAPAPPRVTPAPARPPWGAASCPEGCRALSPIPNGCDCHDNADFSSLLLLLLAFGARWADGSARSTAAVSPPLGIAYFWVEKGDYFFFFPPLSLPAAGGARAQMLLAGKEPGRTAAVLAPCSRALRLPAGGAMSVPASAWVLQGSGGGSRALLWACRVPARFWGRECVKVATGS